MTRIKAAIARRARLAPIDKAMYFTAFVYPLTSIPQVYHVYTTQDASSLAITSWVLYAVFGSIFVAYSISKKLTPLIIEGVIWITIYLTMIMAIVIFR